MVNKIVTYFILIFAFLVLPLTPVHADYENIYHYYIEEALEAFYDQNFDDAVFYFKTAQAIDPSRPQPQQYLNLIKREQEGRLANSGRTLQTKDQSNLISDRSLPSYERLVSRTTEQAMAEILVSYTPQIQDSVIQKAIDNAVDFVKSDSDDHLTDNEWSRVKEDTVSAVIKRVDRLRMRADNAEQPKLKSDTDKQIADSAITPQSAEAFEGFTKTDESPQEIENVRIDLEPSPPIISPLIKPEPPKPTKAPSSKSIAPFKPTAPIVRQTERSYLITDPTVSIRRFYDNEELKLNNELFNQHRTLTLELEIEKNVILTGKLIARYFATLQDLLEINRIDKDRLRVKAVKRGNTILYIWDDTGRWVFNVRCVYPFEKVQADQESFNQELAAPFKLAYSNSWSTLHEGPKFTDIQQKYLIFTNWIGVYGETPYGDFDGSINTYRFPQSTEIVGQRIGLTNGQIGNFKDFTIRGWDTFGSLSELTLAGRNFRGVSLDSYAFRHKLAYSYFYGQDQSVSIYTTEGNLQQRKSYVEGFQVTLNPDKDTNQYTLNYARGFGEARSRSYKDKAYSLESKHLFNDFDIQTELGYDETEIAGFVRAFREDKNMELAVNLRDIHPDYQTVFGYPTNSGQVGASMNLQITPDKSNWNTYLDIYRDRVNPNNDNRNMVNLDFSTSYSDNIDDQSSWGAAIGYVYTPQTFAPRQFLQAGTNYSRNFKVGETKYLSLSLGQSMQWSRFKDSPTSEYDRYSVRTGLSYNLIKNLTYSMSYDYSFVHNVFNDEWLTPSSFNTGLNYGVPIGQKLSLNSGLSYRNEQNTVGDFSFLAGEDSISKTISLTYRPANNISVYLDSQLRRVWRHNTTVNPDYYDLNLMLGMQADWDLPFRWSPTGIIQGIVYKDYNANSLQDGNEPGMPGIKVIAGKYETTTNDNGEYTINVTAKKANVSLDLKTIPQGFVFSTALSRDTMIEHKKAQTVNFGLTSRSGVYGVAFLDINDNGKPDRGDKFIPNVIVSLETGDITKTDYSGSYFFENIKPGTYKIKIDVKSIPMTYTPIMKVETAVILEEGMTYVHNIPLKENPSTSKPQAKE